MPPDLITPDQAFHRQMYVAPRAEELWHWMRSQSGNLDRLKRLHLPLSGKAVQVMADHSAIVAATAGSDARLAQLKVREHLSGTLARLEDIRARYPDYVSPDPESIRSR
jgi:DNA-binding GntR family transcriptional regulator